VTSVRLEAATLADRRRVHQWMTTPGIVERMMGPPDFPDSDVSSFDEFCEDWVEPYWSHAEPSRGRVFLVIEDDEAVGMIAHNEVVTTPDGERAVELDMWLRGPGDAGRGIGGAAIAALLPRLARDLGAAVAFLQPSARNASAIRCYQKAGFSPVGLGPEEAAAHFRAEPDYADSAFYARRLTSLR